MAETYEVKVVYNQSDFRALYRACRRCKRNAILLLLILPVLFGSLSYRDGLRGRDLAFEILPYLLIALIAIFTIYFVGPWNAVRLRRKYGWNEPITVTFTEQGIATRHPNQDSLFYWSKIRDVVVKASRLFLFTTPACAIILPRRCFQSDEQFLAWTGRARDLWEGARDHGGVR